LCAGKPAFGLPGWSGHVSTTNYLTAEEILWTQSAEFIMVARNLTAEIAKQEVRVQEKIVISELKKQIADLKEQSDTEEESEDRRKDISVKSGHNKEKVLERKSNLKSILNELEQDHSKTDTLKRVLENPICKEIIDTNQGKVINMIRHAMTSQSQSFIASQHNERDACMSSHAGGGGGGGFDYEECTSSSEEESNANNGGNRENFSAYGKEHNKADRLEQEALAAEAEKDGDYIDPWAKPPKGSDEDSQDENLDNQGERKGHGRNKKNKIKDAEGYVEGDNTDMTNIYIVKRPLAPKGFVSGRRVRALAIPLRPEHETRLAPDYGLDDAGSSCAKYAV
jgi:hypothetical protein